MIPRNHLDIGWFDLLAAAVGCLRPESPEVDAHICAAWGASTAPLLALSVRSGFDATLGTLNWPADSEVLMSAVTIHDMPRIVRAHGLKPVRIDICPEDLSWDLESLARRISPRTRGIVLAPLMGTRIPLDPVLNIARRHGLFVFEDCAQAYSGVPRLPRTDSPADVTMFSFGLIKTATALGGALLEFRDAALQQRVANHMCVWPIQSRGAFARRILNALVLKGVAGRSLYTAFCGLCRLRGTTHDAALTRRVRSFHAVDFFPRIRQQASFPLRSLMLRRLRQPQQQRVELRAARARRLIAGLDAVSPGSAARSHAWWLVPILQERPDELVQYLWSQGFDATRGASSLGLIDADGDAPAAARMMEHLVYLPCPPNLSPADVTRLQQCLRRFSQTTLSPPRALTPPETP